MLGNCFIAAIRNLLRNRPNTLISVFGLFLGFTATILIALYVRNEYSYDRFFPHSERIYQLGELLQPPGRSSIRTSVMSVTDAPALKLAFPEIESTTRLAPDIVRIRRTGAEDEMTLVAHWADANFFEMLPLPPIAGGLSGALTQPDTVVLTHKTARQLFGSNDPIGKTVDLIGEAADATGRPLDGESTYLMRVVAVIEDIPSNSHLDIGVILPGIANFSALRTREFQQARSGTVRSENVYTYVKLRSGADIEEVRSRLRGFIDNHITDVFNGVRAAQFYTFLFTPLEDIHLAPPSIAAMKPPSDPLVIQAFIGIALLVLVLAVGNFVSMMTARATRRAVEVGVRKATGAMWHQIMAQFVGESLLYSVLALIPAVIAVNLLLPAFNGFLRQRITFDLASNPYLATGIVGLGILTGLAAGAYPALHLSRFRPNVVLKGSIGRLRGSSRLRQGLVVFQFTTLIVLVVATLTIYRQTQYAIEDRLRLPTDEIFLANQSVRCSPAFAESVHNIAGVLAASCASDSTLNMGSLSAIFSSPTSSLVTARAAPVDPGFFNLFDIQPLAGRLLSTQRGGDNVLSGGNHVAENPALVINESAVRALGFESPDDAIGKFRRWTRLAIIDDEPRTLEATSEIVGVVPDFSIGSTREAVDPRAYYLDPTVADVLVLKLKGDTIQEGLEAVTRLWDQQSPIHFNGRFLSQFINDLYVDVRTQSTILAVFSGVAVALASLSILGLAMFSAERRTKEIGVRKVMGALRADILLLLGWQFARPVLVANLIAWPVAYWAMTRWLEGFAYHVELGPMTFLVSGLLALIIALGSVAAHALLVARAKPIGALRYE